MNYNLNYNKTLRILTHLVFWLFVWLFFIFYYYRYGALNNHTLLASLLNLILAVVTVYTFNYYLIPRFLLHNKIGKFVLLSVVAVILFVYLQLLLTISLLIKLLYTEQSLFPQMIDVLILFLNLFFIVFIAISIKFYKRWNERDQKTQLIQKEKVEAELQMLKTQINPHFLFNTLNSIYVLALRNADRTAESVLQLSDILDYILYKVNKPKVLFYDELHIIENYISLEKIRFAERVEVDLNSEVKNNALEIPPMLIIPFVENAFKHGVGKSMEKSWIKILIKEDENNLNIEVSNSKKPSISNSKSSGIGLVNTLKRLSILYGESFNFEKIDAQYNYQIKLSIPK